MLGEHVDADAGSLPPVPIPLRISTHITRQEEVDMGIETELTEKYRTHWKIPGTDGIEPPQRSPTLSPTVAPVDFKS